MLSTLTLLRLASSMNASGYYFGKDITDIRMRTRKQKKAFKKSLRKLSRATTAGFDTGATAAAAAIGATFEAAIEADDEAAIETVNEAAICSTATKGLVDSNVIIGTEAITHVTSTETLSTLTLIRIASYLVDSGYYFGSDITDVKMKTRKQKKAFKKALKKRQTTVAAEPTTDYAAEIETDATTSAAAAAETFADATPGSFTDATTDATTESSIDAATGIETDATTESSTDAAPESSTDATETDATPEIENDATTETSNESSTEISTDATTESSTDAAPESSTDATETDATPEIENDATTETSNESSTESSTAATTESSTAAAPESSTDAAPESSTDAATESSTDAATEISTDATTEIGTATTSAFTGNAETEPQPFKSNAFAVTIMIDKCDKSMATDEYEALINQWVGTIQNSASKLGLKMDFLTEMPFIQVVNQSEMMEESTSAITSGAAIETSAASPKVITDASTAEIASIGTNKVSTNASISAITDSPAIETKTKLHTLSSSTLVRIASHMNSSGYYFGKDISEIKKKPRNRKQKKHWKKGKKLPSTITGSIATDAPEAATAPADTTGIFTAAGIVTVTASSSLSSLTLANIALKMKDWGYYFGSDITEIKRRSSEAQRDYELKEKLEAEARYAAFQSKCSITNIETSVSLEESSLETEENLKPCSPGTVSQSDSDTDGSETEVSSSFERYASDSDSSNDSNGYAMKLNHNLNSTDTSNTYKCELKSLDIRDFHWLLLSTGIKKSRFRSKWGRMCSIELSDFEEDYHEGYEDESKFKTYNNSLINAEDMFPGDIRYGVYTIYEEEEADASNYEQDDTEDKQAEMYTDWYEAIPRSKIEDDFKGYLPKVTSALSDKKKDEQNLIQYDFENLTKGNEPIRNVTEVFQLALENQSFGTLSKNFMSL